MTGMLTDICRAAFSILFPSSMIAFPKELLMWMLAELVVLAQESTISKVSAPMPASHPNTSVPSRHWHQSSPPVPYVISRATEAIDSKTDRMVKR